MPDFLFDSILMLIRTLIVGVLAYLGIIFLLRISGKRTLSKWNAFDFVATIALGSSLATALLSKNVSLAQGLVAFALLIGLQFLITWLSVRFSWIDHLVKAKPAMLLYRGEIRVDVMRRERVTLSELHTALRGKGITDVSKVGAVVLETDGSFSIIGEIDDEGPDSALARVPGRGKSNGGP